MGKKGPMPNFETIDDYIAYQPQSAQIILQKMRTIIKKAAPDAIEVLNYKIPTFTLVPNGKKEHQIMIAGYTNFVSFYPFPTTIDAFSEELKNYKLGKGSVQFPLNEPLPETLIHNMVLFRKQELSKSK